MHTVIILKYVYGPHAILLEQSKIMKLFDRLCIYVPVEKSALICKNSSYGIHTAYSDIYIMVVNYVATGIELCIV